MSEQTPEHHSRVSRLSRLTFTLSCAALVSTAALAGCSNDSSTPRTSDASGQSDSSPASASGLSSQSGSTTDSTDESINPTVSGVPDSQAPGITVTTGRTDRCHTQDLKLTVANENGAAGSTYFDLVFTNTSDHTCTVYGYPGVSYVGGDDGHQIGKAADKTTQDSATLMSLAPNQAAKTTVKMVKAGNFPQNECRPEKARGFMVYPPDETAALFIPFSTQACSGNVSTLNVGPLTKA